MSGWSFRFLSQTILPLSLSVAITLDRLLAGIHTPDDTAKSAGAHIDLVDHAPGVGHIHEAVIDERRRHQILVARAAAQSHREGHAQLLTLVLLIASSGE